MKPSLRFVFDTNVIVSALLLGESISRRAFDRAVEIGKILLSIPVLGELNEVLGRQKFRKYITVDETRRFLAALVREAEWMEVDVKINACRDPSDNIFIELAMSGSATQIISGDNDLLSLSPFEGISVLTPAAFLERFR